MTACAQRHINTMSIKKIVIFFFRRILKKKTFQQLSGSETALGDKNQKGGIFLIGRHRLSHCASLLFCDLYEDWDYYSLRMSRDRHERVKF
jgi:hypothetical protein